MGDARLGRAERQRQLLVVAPPALRVAQDPAGVIDEAQRLLDVAVAVAGLGVVLADHAPQRRPHVFVGRGLGDAQRFVERRLHRRRASARCLTRRVGRAAPPGERTRAATRDAHGTPPAARRCAAAPAGRSASASWDPTSCMVN
jgi:hypothetical protein